MRINSIIEFSTPFQPGPDLFREVIWLIPDPFLKGHQMKVSSLLILTMLSSCTANDNNSPKATRLAATEMSADAYAATRHNSPGTGWAKHVVPVLRDGNIIGSATFVGPDGEFITAGHSLVQGDRYLSKDIEILWEMKHFQVKIIKNYLKIKHTNDYLKYGQGCPPEPDELFFKCLNSKVGYDAVIGKLVNPQKATPFVKLSEAITVGQKVFTVGYPDGELSESQGVVLELKGEETLGGQGIVASAFVGGASSGGALFNEDGELIGITNSNRVNESKEDVAGVSTPVSVIEQELIHSSGN